MAPSKIMLIRHAEKPPDGGGKPYDVKEDGTSGNGHSLIVCGWQRAGALNGFFAPNHSTPSNPAIATPDVIYAANPADPPQRPFETVTPLAAWLNYTPGSAQFNTSFSIRKDEKKVAESVLGLSGTVLVCWEHTNIPDIVKHINDKKGISNYSSIPQKWPDVFYCVWVLDLDGSGQSYTWSSLSQELMVNDASNPA